MPKIRKRFVVAPIIIAALVALLAWLYVQYFPWSGGYHNDSVESSGYQYAKQLQSVDDCNIDPEMLPDDPSFQAGCRAYFK